eukprot:4612705-Pyramimonas_sp.AAC.2
MAHEGFSAAATGHGVDFGGDPSSSLHLPQQAAAPKIDQKWSLGGGSSTEETLQEVEPEARVNNVDYLLSHMLMSPREKTWRVY